MFEKTTGAGCVICGARLSSLFLKSSIGDIESCGRAQQVQTAHLHERDGATGNAIIEPVWVSPDLGRWAKSAITVSASKAGLRTSFCKKPVGVQASSSAAT